MDLVVRVGSRVAVKYPGSDEYHERLFTALIDDNTWTVLTRDEDHYIERRSDYVEMILLGARGGPPQALRRADVEFYRFEDFYDREQLVEIFAEGQRIAADARLAVVVAEPRRLTGKRAVAGGGPALDAGGQVDANEVFILAEPTKVRDVGADVSDQTVVGRFPPLHGSDLLMRVDGMIVRAKAVKIEEGVKWSEERRAFLRDRLGLAAGTAPETEPTFLEDARTLSVAYDARGERGRSFVSGVAALDPQIYDDWPYDPPRTTLYYAKEIGKLGFGPVARHEKWMIDNKLTQDDVGVSEHEVGSEILETLLSYDQVDISNLAGVERLVRRLQFVEEGYRQKLETKRMEKSTDFSGSMAEHFSGKPRMAGGAIVSPALLKHAATKAAEDNDILKQQRKASDVRGLLKHGKK
jgi:hypothetical protein